MPESCGTRRCAAAGSSLCSLPCLRFEMEDAANAAVGGSFSGGSSGLFGVVSKR